MQTVDTLWTDWNRRLSEVARLMASGDGGKADEVRTGMYGLERAMRGQRATRGSERAHAAMKLRVALHYAREQEIPGEELEPGWQMVESALHDLDEASAPLS